MESLAAVVAVPQFNEKPDLKGVAPISIDLIPESRNAAANAPMTAAKTMRIDDDVRVVTLGEYKEAAKALAEAFAEDHTCLYFLDTPDRAHWTAEQKWDLHLSMFEYITYAHLLKGLVISSGPNYDCVGLWYVLILLLLLFLRLTRCLGCRLERTWMICGQSSAAACGA